MATETIVKDYNINSLKESSVPQIWGKNAIFAAVKQKEPTEVQLSDGAVWRMGVQPPFGKITNQDYLRGLDIRHAELIFKLLAFFRDNNINFNHKVDISYYKLLKIIGWERSKQNLEKLKDVLGDLSSIWTTIVTESEIKTFRILSASANWDPQNPENANLEYISFDPTFLEFLGNVELFFSIRLDVFTAMTSNIAKTIYLYMPSRALQNTKATPFRITLTKLFKELNISVPKYKSLRFKTLNQHKKSVMIQLDNALINYSKKLRVSLEETKDCKDYLFCVWSEETTEKDFTAPRRDSLRTWFINGQNRKPGLSSEFDRLIKNIVPLDMYQIETLQDAEIDIDKSKIFLEQSKALLGSSKFDELIADVKGRVLHAHHTQSSKSIKSPIAYLITLIRSELLGELPLF